MVRQVFQRGAEPDDAASAPAERVVWDVRRGLLIVHALLVLLAVGFALRVETPLPTLLADQWPVILIIAGGALLLSGLVAARAVGVLLGPALVALGLVSMLAGQEALAVQPAFVGGALLLALALAVVLRGVSFAR